MERAARFSLTVLRGAIIVYAALCVFVYLLQDWMLFPGAADQGKPDSKITRLEPGAELVDLTTSKGDRVAALYGIARLANGQMDPAARDRPTILYFYGNGSGAAWSDWEFDHFRALPANVLIPDYVGYGMSGGKPSEANLYATADAAYEYLIHQRGVDPRKVVVAGCSLGAAVAIDLASRREVRGLVVFNGFTNLRDMARGLLPWLPTGLLLKYRFDNVDKLSRIHCPTLICNGLIDQIVPPAMSDRLAAAAGGPVTRLKIATAGHDTIFTASPRELLAALGKFLKSMEGDKATTTDLPRQSKPQ